MSQVVITTSLIAVVYHNLWSEYVASGFMVYTS